MRRTRRTFLAAVCLFVAVPAAIGIGGGADALAATGLPTAATGTNTFDNHGGTIVRGYVDPKGSLVTACRFEYGQTEGYGETAACQGEPGEGSAPVEVTLDAQGLIAGAVYHFRVVATNRWGTTESADGVFQAAANTASTSSCSNTGKPGSGVLPDCRAWEMVSPADKKGAGVMPDVEHTRAAVDGSAVSFASLAGFADAAGSGVSFEYMAQRSSDPNPGDSGWSTHAITPYEQPLTFDLILKGIDTQYESELSADLNSGVIASATPLTEEPMTANVLDNLYVRDDLRTPGSGSYQLLSGCPVCAAPLVAQTTVTRSYDGASADFSHLIFEASDELAAGGGGGGEKVYEWDHGVLRTVSVAPDGGTFAQAVAGGLNAAQNGYAPHAISTDGARVVFSTIKGSAPQDLYMRIGGRTTVQLNVPDPGAPASSPAPASYEEASADGRRVFFESSQPLTADAPLGGAKLYMWERAGFDEQQAVAVDAGGGTFTLSFNGATTRPIAFDAPASGAASSVQSALEALATVKAGNVSVTGGPGSAGAASPYVVTFTGDFSGVTVAPLSASAAGLSGGGASASVSTTQTVGNLTLLNRDAEPGNQAQYEGFLGASPDGSYAYFRASKQLVVGQPATSLVAGHPVATYGGQTTGLFVWHEGKLAFVGMVAASNGMTNSSIVQDGKESRVTADGDLIVQMSNVESTDGNIGPTGQDQGQCGSHGCSDVYTYNPHTAQLLCVSCGGLAKQTRDAEFITRELVGGTIAENHLNNPLSEDGRYAFFSAGDALVAQDSNGAEDAYEYDTLTGRVSLISSGESGVGSFFLEATPDGHDVLFATDERLVGWDVDNATDLYDARVDGGFPQPLPLPPQCQGDACQPAAVNVLDTTPSSFSYAAQAGAVAAGGKAVRGAKKPSVTRHRRPKRRHQSKHKRARAKKTRRATTEKGRSWR